jgi:antitoxin MazE
MGLSEGQKVNVTAQGGSRARKPRYRLEDLTANMTPDAMRDAFDWGEPPPVL